MNETGNISYQMVDGEVHLPKDSSYFEITVELNNSSDRNFILYGFKRIMYPILDDSSLCAQRPGAGNGIFITDKEGNRMPEEFTLDISGDYHYRPVTEDTLRNVFSKIRLEYLDGKTILKAREKRLVKLKIDIKSYEPIQQLEPGEYLMYFIYYAGDDMRKMVDTATIKADEKKHKARVFVGWVRSSKAKLIVE